MLTSNRPIISAAQVQTMLKEKENMEVNKKMVRQVFRKDMHLGYRVARTVPVQSNAERCLVLRQQYALKMLPLLKSDRRIINVDESWLN